MQKLLLYFILSLSLLVTAATFAANKAIVLDINGTLTPATQDYIERGLLYATVQKAEVIILQLNSSAGLETVTRHINEAILASPIPVVVYVAPSGAKATSTGTFLLYASHVAAMAPDTKIGAAAPTNINHADPATFKGRITNTLQQKQTTNAISYLRSVAEFHGRNADWAEATVRQSASLSENQALQLHVIEIKANNLTDLLNQLNNRTISLQNSKQTLHTSNIEIETLQPDWHFRFLSMIANPNVAYIFLLIGIYALFFEFFKPGLILPGIIGVSTLLFALFAFNLLPIDYAGLSLLLIGMVFVVLEVFITSYGLLGICGLIAFIFGSHILFEPNLPGYHIAWQTIFIMSFISIAFFLLILFFNSKFKKPA